MLTLYDVTILQVVNCIVDYLCYLLNNHVALMTFPLVSFIESTVVVKLNYLGNILIYHECYQTGYRT